MKCEEEKKLQLHNLTPQPFIPKINQTPALIGCDIVVK
jgi:hypothetical protein